MCLWSTDTPKIDTAPTVQETSSDTATTAKKAQQQKRKLAWGMQQTFTGAGQSAGGTVAKQTVG
jgi:hypothetical protein